jgi:hypothetical protein
VNGGGGGGGDGGDCLKRTVAKNKRVLTRLEFDHMTVCARVQRSDPSAKYVYSYRDHKFSHLNVTSIAQNIVAVTFLYI